LLGELGRLAFRFTDASTTLVIGEYERERESLLRSDLAGRHSHVRAVLSGPQADLQAAERALGYLFDGIHVAFRTWAVDNREDGPRVVGQVIRDVTAVMTARGVLTVQDAPGLATTWLHSAASAELESAAAAALATQAGVRIAIGLPAAGVQGFRDTYRQAERARAIGVVASNGVVAYTDVSLLALLLENRDTAYSFMKSELGALAAHDPATEKLRNTLLVFLEHQGRHLPTAQALFVHRNTVAQQVHRAEEILGREATVRTLELQIALRLQAYFDATVSAPHPRGT
jgi:DNA-binding PucR family transcriptional regulator